MALRFRVLAKKRWRSVFRHISSMQAMAMATAFTLDFNKKYAHFNTRAQSSWIDDLTSDYSTASSVMAWILRRLFMALSL